MFRLVLVCGLWSCCCVGPTLATPVNMNANAVLAARFHSLAENVSRLPVSSSVESSPGVIGNNLVAFQPQQATSSDNMAANGLLFCGLALVLFRWLQPAFRPQRYRL